MSPTITRWKPGACFLASGTAAYAEFAGAKGRARMRAAASANERMDPPRCWGGRECASAGGALHAAALHQQADCINDEVAREHAHRCERVRAQREVQPLRCARTVDR